jgi:ketosteroid isomerase-like protein
MRKAFLVVATLLAAAATAAAHGATDVNQGDAIRARRAAAAQDLARRYFAAYDARDVAAAKALLAPEMKIVGFDARERNVAALLEDIAAASASPPPYRELGDFEVIDAGAVIVIAFDNRITAQSAGETHETVRHRESWVLKPTPGGLRAIWATDSIDGAGPDPHYVPPTTNAATPTGPAAQEQAAADFIARFFDAYIGRRAEEMKALFLPNAKFVFPNAQETSIAAMAEQQAAHPEPPRQYARPENGGHFLDHFEVVHAGAAMVVAFDNHVTDWRSGHPEREEHVFRESWVIRNTAAGLRDVWVAISLYGNAPPRAAAREESHE